MPRWCPNCRAEYVEGWQTCSDCGVGLVARLPDATAPVAPDISFSEPRASRSHEDPWVPIWEGQTLDAEGLSLTLERSHIPVNLGEALEPGHARVEVPRSYLSEARDTLSGAATQWPSPITDEATDELDWRPTLRLALILVAVVLVVLVLIV